MPRKAKITIRKGSEATLQPGILEDGEFGLTTDTWKLFIGLGGQNIFLGEVGAFGDMLKSVYDTDNDGIVDQAEKVEWSGVLNKAIASNSTLGLIKVGANLSVTSDGLLSGNSNPESFIPKSERFTIANGETTFNLTKGYYTPGSLTWSLYGFQQPKEAITEISSTSFSIPPGLPDGTEFEVQYIQTINLTPFPYHKNEHLPGGIDDLGLKAVALSGSYEDLDNKPFIDEISKKVLIGSVSSASYFAFAQTPINPLNYSALFKIVITSPTTTTIGQTLYVWVQGFSENIPMIHVYSQTKSTSASTTGLYYIRGVHPKTYNNGHGGFIELYAYNTTQRDITIEMIESKNVELLSSLTASSYNSTYHGVTTRSVGIDGIATNGTIYGSFSGNASSSTYASNLYNASFKAGEPLIANDIVYLGADSKWYKANISGRTIPVGTIIGRSTATEATGDTGAIYLQGYGTLPNGLTGVINIGKGIYIRGSVSDSNFITDGIVTTELESGYSYMKIGDCVNTTSNINYDGNNRVYSINAEGKIDAIDGIQLSVADISYNDLSNKPTIPTKMSELENDIGAGGGIKITTNAVAPTETSPSDFWYKEV